MCVEALLKGAIRHMQMLVHRTRHKTDRLVTGALKLLFLYVLESSVWVCGKSAYKLTIYKLSYCCMTMLAPAPASLSLKAVLTTIRRMLLPQGCVQE